MTKLRCRCSKTFRPRLKLCFWTWARWEAVVRAMLPGARGVFGSGAAAACAGTAARRGQAAASGQGQAGRQAGAGRQGQAGEGREAGRICFFVTASRKMKTWSLNCGHGAAPRAGWEVSRLFIRRGIPRRRSTFLTVFKKRCRASAEITKLCVWKTTSISLEKIWFIKNSSVDTRKWVLKILYI